MFRKANNPEKEEPREFHATDGMTDVSKIRPTSYFGGGRRIATDEIRLGISAQYKKRGRPTFRRACLRLTYGAKVIAALRWQDHDRLQVLFDKDYIFIRRCQEGLYSVNRISKSNKHMGTTLTLFPPMPFCDTDVAVSSISADFIYQDDGILIAWPEARPTVPLAEA